MPYMLPTSPVTTQNQVKEDEEAFLTLKADRKINALNVEGLLAPSQDGFVVIQPPTPDRANEADDTTRTATDVFGSPSRETTSSSTSTSVSSSSNQPKATFSNPLPSRSKSIKSTPLSTSTVPYTNQVVPQVRSPPKHRVSLNNHDQFSDMTGLVGVPTGSSLSSQTSALSALPTFTSGPGKFTHMDSYDLTCKRNRRPKLFGFTEMFPDSPESSDTGSRPNSACTSRDSSPTRTPSMELIPRTKRFNGSLEKTINTEVRSQPTLQLERKKDVLDTSATSPEAQKKGVQIAEPTTSSTTPVLPASAVTVVRKTSLNRSHSELGIRNLSHRANLLSTRTSAQRNESALKLDLNGIRSQNTAPALGSAPIPGMSGPYSPATALLRKKSGEVVKPALKAVSSYSDVTALDGPLSSARSAPTTPGGPKYVHFDTQLERVKLFLHDQKPQVVSRQGSPTECTTSEGEEYPFPATDDEVDAKTQLELRLPNFPTSQPRDTDIALESLFLDEERKNLKGIIRVRNIAFDKWVAVRFTYDWWQTTSETSATYKDSLQGGEFDRFQFSLKLQDMMSKIEEKNLFICLRYMAGTTESWDNNGGSNYHVKFAKAQVQSRSSLVPSRPSVSNGTGLISPGMGRSIGGRSSQWDLAGKKQDRMADLRMHLDRLSAGDDDESKPSSVPSARFSNSVRGSPSKKIDGLPQPRSRSNGPSSPQPMASPLGHRYDFGASLSNARGGKARSPSGRTQELPLSPSGLTFPSITSTVPSMEFYSPQLSNIDLPSLDRRGSVDQAADKPSSLRLDTLPPPVLQVQEPSPPMDYFTRSAPAGTVGPTRTSTSPPRTALPKLYSEPLFAVPSLYHETSFGSDVGNALGLQGDSISDASPPSMAESIDSGASSSPTSPVGNDFNSELPAHRSSSVDDISNMSYKSILEQLCWAGDQTSSPPIGKLDQRRIHSTSDVNKYFVNHLEMARPVDLPIEDKAPSRFSGNNNSLFKTRKKVSPPGSKKSSPPGSVKRGNVRLGNHEAPRASFAL